MADPTTQSRQISSSQGLNDGRAKDSQFSDSFFSSSSVSLIQSPQDKRVALDSEKPSEGVPTSLRFSSQPSSFSPATYGNDNSVTPTVIKDRSFQEKRELFESSLGSQKQNSCPIKISPVSERIRALEALAAKQNDSDWNDTGFNFRERHYEKSHSEIHSITLRSSVKKKPTSSEQDSPESPFEILGDSRRGSDFEDTADWMRAHLPPAPNFNITESDFDEIKEASVMPECPSETKSKDTELQVSSSSFVGVPDEFMDNTAEVSKKNNEDSNQYKQDTIEDESEFDLRFLPTAYMWGNQEKPDVDTQEPPVLSEIQNIPSAAAPPDCFEASSLESFAPVPQTDSNVKEQAATVGVGAEGVQIFEADSSGESDDTVIEDESDVSNGDAVKCGFSADNQMIPSQQEKLGLQVPIINVIETEDQVLSDYEVEEEEDEDERYQIMQEPATKAPQLSEERSDISLSEFDKTAPKMDDLTSLEHASDSDKEYSPKHDLIDDFITNDLIDQTSLSSKIHILENSNTESALPQNTENTESSFSIVKSKETTEIVPELHPKHEDSANDFESSEVDTYLDHYISDELALEGQLNSGVFAIDNMDINETLKSNSLQTSQNSTSPPQQSNEKTDNEFDETVNNFEQNNVTEPEPFPANILVDVPVLPISSQNNMPQLELVDQNVEIKKMITDSGNFSLIEEEDCMTRHEVEVSSFQQCTLAQFPSLHNDLSSNVIEVISDFVPCNVTEEILMTNTEPDEIIQVNEPHPQISSEPKSKPESVEAESKQNEYPIVQIDRSDAADTQICEEHTNIPKHIEKESEKGEMFQCHAPDTQISPETPDKLESTEAKASLTASTDSFVEFMKECLKSQQDDKPLTTKEPVSVAPSSPAIIMHLEQECITICTLKALGSSSDEQDDIKIPKDISAKDPNPQPLQSKPLICSNPSPCTLPHENQPDASLTKEIEALDILVAEAYHLAEHVLALILTHLTVHDLVYWRDPKKTGLVFGISLLMLLSLAAFSVISIISYLLLALLCVTISYRIYKSVMQAVQKSSDGHPFKQLMEKDVSLPPETFRKHVDSCLTYINCALKKMSRLFLVEDLVDSLKLAVVMWLMTYVGAVFNGITILILVDILAFTVPPLYEKYKTQIDRYVNLVRTQVNSVVAKIQEKLPKAVKRSKAE